LFSEPVKPTVNHMRQASRGIAAVELGLLLIPLVLLVFGTTEYGRAIYTFNTLDKGVRDAVRYLAQGGPGDLARQGEATCLIVHGNMGCAGPALIPGLAISNVNFCDAISCPSTHLNQPTGSGAIDLMTVTIQNYRFDSLMPFVVPSLDFNSISATMRSQ
jgi:hypothetical protein